MSNTPNATTTYHQGGAVGVSFGSGNSAPDIPGLDHLNGNTGSGRLIVNPDGSQSAESLGVTTVNVGELQNEQRAHAQSILDTARAPHGGRAGKLGPNTVVMVNGMETSLAVAEQLGYVMRNASGEYAETSHSPYRQGDQRSDQAQQQNRQQQPKATDGDSFEFKPEELSKINEMIESLPQHVYEGSLHKAINFGLNDLNYNDLADQLGIAPEDAQQRAQFIHTAYKGKADILVRGIVGEPDDFYAWSQSNNPKAHAEAVTKFVFGNDASALKALAQKYMKSTNPEDDTLRQAGFETKTEQGTHMVRIQGVWMTVRAAVKAGYI